MASIAFNDTVARGKHMLLAVVGTTPQVVSETLYGLMVQRKIQIDEIFVVTTTEGMEKLMAYPRLEDEIGRLCNHYKIKKPLFNVDGNVILAKEESVELHDIRSDRENRLIPNIVCDLVRNKAEDPHATLHCSLAGGRKTMSVAMAFALSLFGRKRDKLYHVLVTKEFEESKKYFPETPDEERQVVLSEVPYIRLREKLPLLKEHPRATFSELAELAQEEIDDLQAIPQLHFDKENCVVEIGEKRIKLQPFDFAFYLFIAKQKKPVPGGKRFSEKNWQELEKIYEDLHPYDGHRERIKKTIEGKDREQRLTKSASNIRRIFRQELGQHLARFYFIESVGGYGKLQYQISLDRRKMRF